MAVAAVYHIDDSCEVWWDEEIQYVKIDGEQVVSEDGIDDLIEALQRIKADLARAKGGAA
jgi:hypothetical protein